MGLSLSDLDPTKGIKNINKQIKTIFGGYENIATLGAYSVLNPELPETEPTKVAPTLTDAQRLRAARRKMALREGGRSSTILSEGNRLG